MTVLPPMASGTATRTTQPAGTEPSAASTAAGVETSVATSDVRPTRARATRRATRCGRAPPMARRLSITTTVSLSRIRFPSARYASMLRATRVRAVARPPGATRRRGDTLIGRLASPLGVRRAHGPVRIPRHEPSHPLLPHRRATSPGQPGDRRPRPCDVRGEVGPRAEVLLHVGRVRADGRAPRRHHEQLAVRGPARARAVRQGGARVQRRLDARTSSPRSAAFADKVIFNSVGAAAGASRGRASACRSACASTPVSATRTSISPIRPAAHSRLGVDRRRRAARRSSPTLSRADVPLQLRERRLRRAPRRRRRHRRPLRRRPAADGVDQPRWWHLLHRRRLPGRRFSALLRELAERFGVQVYLEPGEAVITGTARARDDRARRRAQRGRHRRRRCLDRGAHARPSDLRHAPARRRRRRPGRIRSRSPAAPAWPVTCSASSRSTEPLRVGDEVRFADAAGYTMVKTTWFNGLRMPSIVVRRLDGTRRGRPRVRVRRFRAQPCPEQAQKETP